MSHEELVDKLDEETVLKLKFHGHCDQYLYQFPSGLMVLAWGDEEVQEGQIGLMTKDYCLDKLESRDPEELELVNFEDTPFASEY